MFKKLILSSAIVLGAILASGSVFVNDVKAELVYDAATKSWIKPIQRPLSQRKPHKKFERRSVLFKTNEAPGTLIIHTDKKFLYFVEGNNKATRYGVGVGKEGFGWNGVVKIKRKVEWPTWTPPAEMRIRERKEGRELPISMKGGIDNPLGARAMYLYKGGRDTLYRIHGTNQPWSIGLNLSSGCIRMMNKDVEHLYKRVNIGTKVVVVGPGKNPAQLFTEVTNPIAALFGG
ncbi:MAG: L,D-transpeptidase [Nitratireductor sp.]